MKTSKFSRAIAFTLTITLALSIMYPAVAAAAGFSDVAGHWAAKDILMASASQVVSGYNGQFWPNKNVTRAQFTVMIVNALGLETEAAALKGELTGYTDLKSSHFAVGHILLAKEQGLISGYPDGSYKPEKEIRRDEITSILIRAVKLYGSVLEETDNQNLKEFSDLGNIPEWAKDSVSQAVGLKLITGFPDGSFRSAKYATRGETAVLINRLLREFNRDFTLIGRVLTVDKGNSELSLEISEQQDTYTYDTNTVFYAKSSPMQPRDLKVGDWVGIIVAANGTLSYVEHIDSPVATLGRSANAHELHALSFSTAKTTGEASATVPQEKTVQILVITRPGKFAEVKKQIFNLGGQVIKTYPQINYLVATIESSLLPKLAESSDIDCINIDRVEKDPSLEVGTPEEADQNVAEQDTATGNDPRQSLAVNKSNIKADSFSESKGVDGKSQLIAILDTGVDPGHPDLQTTTDGKRKIAFWMDFTDEGLIDTKAIAKKSGTNINLVDGNYLLGSIVSKSGNYHYGYITESDIYTKEGDDTDINFNGVNTDAFAVLVVDDHVSGKYEKAYVDTDMDKDFTDEKPLTVYNDNPSFASFTGKDGRDVFNVNMVEVKDTGAEIHLGFDGNDHGTHIAGIAAANGYAKGVAPGAQIMALKVLKASGSGSWSDVSDGMMYAVTHGAKIINMSLGFKPYDFVGGSVPAKLINTLTKEYGAIFVVASGNDGPGLGSLSTPGDADMALSVGAYISPEMWKVNYGWTVPDENLRFISGVGPRGDGAMVPRIVAPGDAVSTGPLRGGEKYFRSYGTSMSAPHVAGSLALLMEEAAQRNLAVSPLVIKRAIELGAAPIKGYSYAEQGYGLVNVVQAWRELQFIKDNPAFLSSTYNAKINQGAGLFEQDYLPGRLDWYLRNDSGASKELTIYSHADWIRQLKNDTILVPAGQTRDIPLEFDIPRDKGLYSALVRADDERTYGVDMDFLVTVINPYILEGEHQSESINDTLNPAAYKRYFFKVMPGASALGVSLDTPRDAEGRFQGKVRFYLFDPAGTKKEESDFSGGESSGSPTVEMKIDNPMAGTWEVIVYSSASLSDLGLKNSEYTLHATVPATVPVNLPVEDRNIIVSMLPRVVPSGRDSYVTLQIRNRGDKKPYQGVVLINDELYYTRKGYITLSRKKDNALIGLTVKTVTDINRFVPLEFQFPFN